MPDKSKRPVPVTEEEDDQDWEKFVMDNDPLRNLRDLK